MPPRSQLIVVDGTAIGIACSRVAPITCTAEAGCCSEHATKQCDYPVKYGTKSRGTCSKHICDKHAVRIDGDRDYCPAHARKHQRDEAGR